MQLQNTPTTETDAPQFLPSGASDTPMTGSSMQTGEIRAPAETKSVSDSTVEAAIEQWHSAQAERFRRELAHQSWIGFRSFLIVVGSILTMLLLLPFPKFYVFSGGMIVMSLCIVVGGARYAPPTSQSVEAIAEMEDVRAAGPLLEILDTASPSKQERAVICSALIRLLPCLAPGGATLLTSRHWQALHGCIISDMAERHPDFVTACLEVIEGLGSEKSLPSLTLLVVHDAPTPNMQAVRARAKQCLRSLVARLDFGTVSDIPNWIAKLPYSYKEDENNKRIAPEMCEEYMIAAYALTRLLPQLTPADAPLLNKEARRRLGESVFVLKHALTQGGHKFIPGGFITSRLGSDYDLARLAAFEQIGTGSDLPFAQSCLNSMIPSEDLPRVRARVKAVVAVLEARRVKEEAGETLLRGASAPPIPSDELLRPAQAGGASTAPGELLRPNSDTP